MNCHHLFPQPLWHDHLTVDNDELSRILHSMRDADPNGSQVSNIMGYQSSKFDVVPMIHDDIISRASIIMKEYCTKTPVITDAWFNINGHGATNAQHHHPGAFLSGVYYVKASQQSGAICFHRDASEAFIIQSFSDHLNDLTTPIMTLPVREGLLLLFPSWLTHSVQHNTDQYDRISIAFNISI